MLPLLIVITQSHTQASKDRRNNDAFLAVAIESNRDRVINVLIWCCTFLLMSCIPNVSIHGDMTLNQCPSHWIIGYSLSGGFLAASPKCWMIGTKPLTEGPEKRLKTLVETRFSEGQPTDGTVMG